MAWSHSTSFQFSAHPLQPIHGGSMQTTLPVTLIPLGSCVYSSSPVEKGSPPRSAERASLPLPHFMVFAFVGEHHSPSPGSCFSFMTDRAAPNKSGAWCKLDLRGLETNLAQQNNLLLFAIYCIVQFGTVRMKGMHENDK
ncbi:hypothetical protein AVEN_198509-1 [Araneus ventricosus]|uniref:Uncharacterized protein n=1 Tax=Araneus ventricosus TaxID=182803 RepID=A0A4Y2T4W2_ARAVE|nr:hypothetical protein AVEN_198509-1 [Araneus ventricosus]